MTTTQNDGEIKLLYLVSLGFSGSTLAAFLLGSHPDIATVGELSGPDPRMPKEEHPCSCGTTTQMCLFWQRIRERLADKGIHYSVFEQEKRWRCSQNRFINFALTQVVNVALIDRLQNMLLQLSERVQSFYKIRTLLMREILDDYQAAVFLDTDKEIDRLQVLRRNQNLDIKVLHLVRDGRGQLCSQVRRGRNVIIAARRIANFDLQASKLQNVLGNNRYMLLKYEDMCSDPKKYMGRVAEFVGLNREGFPEGFQGKILHLFGNPMSSNFKGDVILDERWKSELTEENLAIFEKIAGKRNRQFGYL